MNYMMMILWTVSISFGLQSKGNMCLSGVAAKFFLATLCHKSIFRSLETGFCDLPHKGYLEFSDPPHKRVVKFSDPPTDLLVPPCRS